MKWITPDKIKIKYRKTYYAKWDSGTVIKSTGWFQESDGTFFWNEQGYIPVLKKEWPMLLILDESPSGEQGVQYEYWEDVYDIITNFDETKYSGMSMYDVLTNQYLLIKK